MVFCEIIPKALTACNSAASSATVSMGSVNWTDGIWAWMVVQGDCNRGSGVYQPFITEWYTWTHFHSTPQTL